jgi:TonB family protein
MRKLLILPALFIMLIMSKNEAHAQKVYDFVSVSTQPTFPGGMPAFYQYLAKNIKYPANARKNNTQGKVFVTFIVEESGALTDVSITRGLSKETDAEALRVIKESPKWNPGKVKSKLVRVKYNLVVNFSLA